MKAENLLTWTLLMSWFLQKLVRKKKCVFAVMFEGERLLTVGCRTTCVRKNVVGRGTARAQNTDADRYSCAVCRFPGAVAGSSGNTVKPVLDPAVCPATVTESVWTEPTEPESVTVTTVSTEQPVRPARVASMVSTAIRVGSPCLHQTATGRPPVHSDSLSGQTAPVKTVAVVTVSPAMERVSVTLAGEASSVMKVGHHTILNLIG